MKKTNFLKTKKGITAWLNRHEVENYTLIQDPIYGYVVDVDGPVHLSQQKLKSITIKRNAVLVFAIKLASFPRRYHIL